MVVAVAAAGGPAREEHPQTPLRVEEGDPEEKALAATPHPLTRLRYVAILKRRVRMEPRRALLVAEEAAASMH